MTFEKITVTDDDGPGCIAGHVMYRLGISRDELPERMIEEVRERVHEDDFVHQVVKALRDRISDQAKPGGGSVSGKAVGHEDHDHRR